MPVDAAVDVVDAVVLVVAVVTPVPASTFIHHDSHSVPTPFPLLRFLVTMKLRDVIREQAAKPLGNGQLIFFVQSFFLFGYTK